MLSELEFKLAILKKKNPNSLFFSQRESNLKDERFNKRQQQNSVGLTMGFYGLCYFSYSIAYTAYIA